METLIKSVRQSLYATCKNQPFTKEQWRTFLSETTYIVNGRPLYPKSNAIWETPLITPNDVLIGNIFRHLNQNQRKGSTPDIFWQVHKIELTNSGNAGWDTSRQIYCHQTNGSESEKMFNLLI